MYLENALDIGPPRTWIEFSVTRGFLLLKLDARAQHREEFREPRGMRRPRWRGDEITVGDGFGHGKTDVCAPGQVDVGTHCRIGTALFPFKDAGGSKDLCRVANSGDGFVGFRKVANNFDYARVKPNVFRRSSAG